MTAEPEHGQHRVNPVPKESQAQDAGTLEGLRQVAERLLGLRTLPGAGGDTGRLYVGAPPADFPFAVPVPVGGHILGGSVRWGGGRLRRATVLVSCPISVDKARAFYEHALQADGWQPPRPARGRTHGFTAAPTAPNTVNTVFLRFLREEQAPWLTLSVGPALPELLDHADEVGGRSEVRLEFDGTNPPPRPSHSWWPSLAMALIPELVLPAGTGRLRHGGGGGSDDRYNTSAVTETTLSPSDLAAHFAGQRTTLGWEWIGGDSDHTGTDGNAGSTGHTTPTALAWRAWAASTEVVRAAAQEAGETGETSGVPAQPGAQIAAASWCGLLTVWARPDHDLLRRPGPSLYQASNASPETPNRRYGNDP